MLISIITPVYNVEKYLSHCLDSILAQTFRDFELILVDDGSTDSSGAICDEYAARDSRVYVEHIKNSGPAAARNYGLKIAKGKYVMFCDSDDIVEPQWCEIMLSQIKMHPTSWCFCGYHYIDENDVCVDELCLDHYAVIHDEPVFESMPMSAYGELRKTKHSVYIWNRIFDMAIIRDHKLRFDEKLTLSEDVLFDLQYAQYCTEFLAVNLPLCSHRLFLKGRKECLSIKNPAQSVYMNRRVYEARKPLICPEDVVAFNTDYFYRFIDDMKAIAKSSEYTMLGKIVRIQKILFCKEFVSAFSNADTSKENWKILWVLKAGISPVAYWLFKK